MTLNLRVGSHITFDYRDLASISPEALAEFKSEFHTLDPNYFFKASMGYVKNMTKYHFGYETYKYDFKVYRGLVGKFKEFLAKHNIKYAFTDQRFDFRPVIFDSNITLRTEQRKAVDAIKNAKQGVVIGPCGVGKTIVLLQAIAEIAQPALVVVWDTNLQKQWINEAVKFLKLKESEIGGVGGVFKKEKFGNINICMQQSLWIKDKRDFFTKKIGLVAMDECQRASARTFKEVLNQFPAKYRIGVTASTDRQDKLGFLINWSFGPIIHKIIPEESKNTIQAKISLVPSPFEKNITQIVNDWPLVITALSKHKARNDLIVRLATEKIKQAKIVLILTERKSHMLDLFFRLEQFKTHLLFGKTTKKYIKKSKWPKKWKEFINDYDYDDAFTNIKSLSETRDLDCIIATQKGNVGLDIKTLDHLIITMPSGGNPEKFRQQVGRVERKHPTKKEATVDYVWDNNVDFLRYKGIRIKQNFENVTSKKVNNTDFGRNP